MQITTLNHRIKDTDYFKISLPNALAQIIILIANLDKDVHIYLFICVYKCEFIYVYINNVYKCVYIGILFLRMRKSSVNKNK